MEPECEIMNVVSMENVVSACSTTQIQSGA